MHWIIRHVTRFPVMIAGTTSSSCGSTRRTGGGGETAHTGAFLHRPHHSLRQTHTEQPHAAGRTWRTRASVVSVVTAVRASPRHRTIVCRTWGWGGVVSQEKRNRERFGAWTEREAYKEPPPGLGIGILFYVLFSTVIQPIWKRGTVLRNNH